MPSNGFPFQSLALEPAIDPHFLSVKADVALTDVLAMMSRIRSSCVLPAISQNRANKDPLTETPEDSLNANNDPTDQESVAGCVLVMDNAHLLGVFTERDIVRLTATGTTLAGLSIGEVVTKPAIALPYSPDHDIFTALSLFRQHRIRHLPILNEAGTPIGIVTHQGLRRALQPINLLTRLRYVRDVMATEVIHAPVTASILDLAHSMTEHRVSCVVICEPSTTPENSQSLIPVGIVTERDLVQFQALELDLSRTQAQTVMSTPLFCLHSEDSLWYAHQTMSEQRVRRLVVVGSQGELKGIISQTSLLQVLNPADMYGLIEILQSVVDERTTQLEQTNKQLRREILERERAEAALRTAHDQLKGLVEERTAQLRQANAKLRQDILQRERIEAALRISEAQLRSQANQLQTALDELQNAQLKLIQTEKMSSLGQLVAGIAHEINNPTNFIYGNLTYAEEYVQGLLELLNLYGEYYTRPAPEIQQKADAIDLDFVKTDLLKLLDSMKSGAERIRNLVLSLRNFSRLDEAQVKFVDIHEGLDSTLVILQNKLKTRGGHLGIQMIKEYGQLPSVECSPGQLNQVFMNILSNAIDALEQKVKNSDYSIEGNLEQDSDSSEMAKNVSSTFPSYREFSSSSLNGKSEEQRNQDYSIPTIWIKTSVSEEEECVWIRIADNGCGMASEVQERLFDPFFTTKSPGKGTGLGLAISYQIVVEKHKGRLECVSRAGKGTEFAIAIPIQQADSANGGNVVRMPNRFRSS